MPILSSVVPTRRFRYLALLPSFGTALLLRPVVAQPTVNPAVTKGSTYSIEELERFIGGRTLVTMDVKDATLKEVAAALSQSTGLPVSLSSPRVPARVAQMMAASAFRQGAQLGGNETLYSLTAKQQPYWEAMRQWHQEARSANLAAKKQARAEAVAQKKPFSPARFVAKSFNAHPTPTGLELDSGEALAGGRAVASWPVLLIGQTLQRSQRARLSEEGLDVPDTETATVELPTALVGNVPAQPEKEPNLSEDERWIDSLTLNVAAFIDPKISLGQLRCEIVEAVDDQNNDLRFLGANSQQMVASAPDKYGTLPLPITLASRPNMGKRLSKLRGVLRFDVVSRVQHWETTDLTKPVDDTLHLEGGDFKISFDGLKKTGDQWNGTFSATSKGRHLENFWTKRFANRDSSSPVSGALDFKGVPTMRLVDARGNTVFGTEWNGTFALRNLKPFDANNVDANNVNANAGALPAVLSPDLSPIPLDVATNWEYNEKHNLEFRPVSTLNGAAPALGEGVKLIVDFPIERREISVPFEFTDLPLPPS